MTTTPTTSAHLQDARAAMRVANTIGFCVRFLTFLMAVLGGAAAVFVGVISCIDHNMVGVGIAVVVAVGVGLITQIFWLTFGWFEHTLRMLVRIAERS